MAECVEAKGNKEAFELALKNGLRISITSAGDVAIADSNEDHLLLTGHTSTIRWVVLTNGIGIMGDSWTVYITEEELAALEKYFPQYDVDEGNLSTNDNVAALKILEMRRLANEVREDRITLNLKTMELEELRRDVSALNEYQRAIAERRARNARPGL
jgi:hypothetical protein